MLSICIPIYNFDVNELVLELASQTLNANLPWEIVLIDDKSEESFRKINKPLSKISNYIELDQNVGRSKIRNLFLKYAKYEYLLFLDCDSKIIKGSFIDTYLSEISNGDKHVFCGGRVYPKEKPGKDRLLRWKYGLKRESKPAEIRAKDPNKSFMTNNFVIKKELLKSIRFDEGLIGYGHEDTLFGYALLKKDIAISQIDNPVLNGDLETNEEYLLKTKEGIKNLCRIYQIIDDQEEFSRTVNLLNYYNFFKKYKLIAPIQFLFYLNKPVLEFMLRKACNSVVLFNIYKLGLLIQYMRKAN